MNIDLKARAKNKSFWVYIISGIVTLTQLFGFKIFPDNWTDILNTILGILLFMGIIVDNSTNGLSDNKGVE
jgi:phi LC3 family holin